MRAYLLDWLLLPGSLHLLTGVVSIGAASYLIWLDNYLQTPPSYADFDCGVAGELRAPRGGDFYRSQKYHLAPTRLPSALHWFYGVSYPTWLSGFTPLCLKYFLRAEVCPIDPNVVRW
jgi:uncharacterized membrane protein